MVETLTRLGKLKRFFYKIVGKVQQDVNFNKAEEIIQYFFLKYEYLI